MTDEEIRSETVWNGVELTGTGLASVRGVRPLFSKVHLRVRSGELLVLRGQNGSGKTTLLRILAGLNRPTLGKVTLTGASGEGVHLVGHTLGLKPFETPRQHLRNAATTPSVDRALAALDLQRPADVPVKSLSAGQKRRTALARLLVAPRPVWLLDEPFASLDQSGTAAVEALINHHLASGGTAVIALHGHTRLTSHHELHITPPEAIS